LIDAAVLPKPKNVSESSLESPTMSAATINVPTKSNDAPKIAFRLLSRDNKGRIEARQLLVPQENSMAQKLMQSEEEARLEKQKLKERTLLMSSMNSEEVKFFHLLQDCCR
jgi:hypothetical protein